MDFFEKVITIMENKGLSTQQVLAAELGVNYIVMNRNIKANKITSDFILAVAKRFPDIDLNWLIKENYIPVLAEPTLMYGKSDPLDVIEAMKKLLHVLENDLTQK